MNKTKSGDETISALTTAIIAGLATANADASTYTAVLKGVVGYAGFGSAIGNVASSTATFTYDDVTGLLTQTGGTFNVRFTVSPATTFFRHSIAGLVIGAAGPASASSFTCTEGNFGTAIGAHLCGNYSFGANYLNDSTVTWGPGTATSRTLGGDDGQLPLGANPQVGLGNHTFWLGSVSGQQHSTAYYNGFSTISWVGTTLVLSNGSCSSALYGSGGPGCVTLGGYNQGYQWTLETTPVPAPAAGWLFGAALLGLGRALRRRAG